MVTRASGSQSTKTVPKPGAEQARERRGGRRRQRSRHRQAAHHQQNHNPDTVMAVGGLLAPLWGRPATGPRASASNRVMRGAMSIQAWWRSLPWILGTACTHTARQP